MRTRTPAKIHYTIDDVKRKLEFDHSEKVFGIEPEIPLQCSRIDNIFKKDIASLFEHVMNLQNLLKDDENDEDDRKLNKVYIDHEIEIINTYESTLDNQFEEMRHACESLRARGDGWKRLARNLFDKMPNNKLFLSTEILKKLK